ncbi:MAG: SMI1/KNR4 family protein [Chitinophagaceae bacterium]|nr:SMI1/KNR4 family protein [Chitinophagaceae bacterium]
MNVQLNRISEKIGQLKKLDKHFALLGSQKHKYKLNPTILLDKVRQFEQTYNVTLPKDYVGFITTLGNGGVGPYYGLEPFENCLFDDLDYKRIDSLLNPSKPFLHTEPWNLKFSTTIDQDENEDEYEKEYSKFEEQYFDKEQINGVIAICNYGCAISLNLVVNGQEYGNIWTDDRGSDKGIYPSHELGNKDKISFLDWYELWLDNSLNEIKSNLFGQNVKANVKQQGKNNEKSWWKIW